MKLPAFLRLAFAFVIALAVTGLARAEGARERMEQRLPALDAMKTRGVVGENNQGFLEVRDGGGEAAAKLVAAENQDRTLVYANIAKKYNTTPDEVGRRRARKIAENSSPGVWLQAPDGTWYQKK
ncbi:MAG TPA: YdbL family protein [Opitutaceae bacterium]|nr:YdbL family protein [Opitutaceae bacterium]